jgi:hypothetical protein
MVQKELVEKKNYSEDETNLVEKYLRQYWDSPKPIKFTKKTQADGSIGISAEYDDDNLHLATMQKTTGTLRYDLSLQLIKQAALAGGAENSGLAEEMFNCVSSAMLELSPRDGFEGMLVSQMTAVHNQAMECLRRVTEVNQPIDILTRYQNQAVKLMKTFTAQLEALNKHRRKGKQQVVVEHVNVNQGGQAIVGNIEHRGGGGD